MSENDTQSVRSLATIAAEIESDWSARGKGVSPYAVPYLDAMSTLNTMRDSYWADSAATIVRYFLANAGTWRGETARRVKAELNSMLKDAV